MLLYNSVWVSDIINAYWTIIQSQYDIYMILTSLMLFFSTLYLKVHPINLHCFTGFTSLFWKKLFRHNFFVAHFIRLYFNRFPMILRFWSLEIFSSLFWNTYLIIRYSFLLAFKYWYTCIGYSDSATRCRY